MIKNLIFDVDGTIWDSTEVVARAWKKAAEELSLPTDVISATRLKKEFGKPMNEIFESMFPEYIGAGIFDKLHDLLYVYEHDFLEENEENLAYPKMKETMKHLSKHLNLYIVSNCQKGYIEQVMRKTGIQDYILDHTCYGETLKTKDRSIQILIEKNGLIKEECVYVGDIYGDEVATHKAGLAFCHAAWGFGEAKEPEYVAKDYGELEKVFI